MPLLGCTFVTRKSGKYDQNSKSDRCYFAHFHRTVVCRIFPFSLKDCGSLIKTAQVWVDDRHKVCPSKPTKGHNYCVGTRLNYRCCEKVGKTNKKRNETKSNNRAHVTSQSSVAV